jgi:hypothetical protein
MVTFVEKKQLGAQKLFAFLKSLEFWVFQKMELKKKLVDFF